MSDDKGGSDAKALRSYDDVPSGGASAPPTVELRRSGPDAMAPTRADEYPRTEISPMRAATPVHEPTGREPTGREPTGRTPPGHSTLIPPSEALRVGQSVRVRQLVWAVFGMCALVAALLPVVRFSATTKTLIGVAMAGVMVALLWMYSLLGKPEKLTDRAIVLPWGLLVMSLYVGILGFGVFSPGLLAFVLAVYFVGQRHGLGPALTIYIFGALAHLGLVAAIFLGGIADPGVFPAPHFELRELCIIEGHVQLMFAGSFLIARTSRRAITESVEELQRATHAAAQREALLLEAREELERAMRVGGAGRFTDQVLGSFRLGAVLGRGAMGEVYEATHEPTGELAAVKLIRADALGRPGRLERFLREAMATSKLDSPHVVRVLEIGDETAPLPYIAMERLHGQDLAFYLRARPRLPGVEVADLLAQLARGVDAAHRAGIVHRDLKPQNVFLHQAAGAAAVWKILDFGVSKLRDQDATINPGHLVGTPSYMAPEQIRGTAVDGRADVYALGVIAFRALTGEPPFRGRDTPELLYNVVHAPTPMASRRTPDISPAVDAVLARALAKQPDDRFACAADLATALAQALDATR